MKETPQALAARGLARAESGKVSLSGGRTAYWKYPAAEPKSGKQFQQVIFVHGYRGNHHGLEAIAGALPEFEILIPDLPGFGDSEPFSGKHTVAAYAEWLTEFINSVARPGAIVLGHSFGSIVTAAAAAKGLSNRLILVNPVSSFERSRREKTLERLTNLFYGFGGILPERPGNHLLSNPAMVRLMSGVLAKTRDKRLRGWIHAQHAQNFSDYAERRVAVEGYASSTSRSVASYARDIENRTFLIAGELDDITSVRDQQRTLHLFRNAELKVIHGVGHLIHYETPYEAAQLIRDFANNG